jgi:hypothetical protein
MFASVTTQYFRIFAMLVLLVWFSPIFSCHCLPGFCNKSVVMHFSVIIVVHCVDLAAGLGLHGMVFCFGVGPANFCFLFFGLC